ncbi:hypothetical protein [Pseudomonas yamanorum]|uniref:hypothetical protein n=1 Tax=Pseudomonas yamanorum TaxID=515393 RepID=UPI003F74FA0B
MQWEVLTLCVLVAVLDGFDTQIVWIPGDGHSFDLERDAPGPGPSFRGRFIGFDARRAATGPYGKPPGAQEDSGISYPLSGVPLRWYREFFNSSDRMPAVLNSLKSWVCRS